MKIRMKMSVSGAFHDMPGPKIGDVVEVPDEEGARYCELGYAEPVAEKSSDKAEKAVAPKAETRSGVMKTSDK